MGAAASPSDARDDRADYSAPCRALPQAVLEAGTLLLGADDDPAFAVAVSATLERVGRAGAMHRATLIEYVDDDGAAGNLWWQVAAEWHAPDVVAQGATAQVRGRLADAAHWAAQVADADAAVDARTEELRDDAFRQGQESLGARYLLVAPIRLDGRVWGCLAFDDCRTDRRRTVQERALLAAAAQTVGLAVHRHQTRARVAAAERAHLAALADERARGAVAVVETRAVALDRANVLLRAAVDASRALLDAADLDTGAGVVLALLGSALAVDRVALAALEPAADGGFPWCTLTHEWTAPGVPRQRDDPALRRVRFAAPPEDLARLLAGSPIQATLEDIPEPHRSEQRAAGVRASFAMPIRVDGRTWGVLGSDDCRRARTWPAEELEFLRVVTLAIAAAIKRRDAEQARVAADARRAALLGAVAQAAEALTRTPHLPTALAAAGRVLGEATGVDRVNVMRYDHARAAGFLHAEWARPGVSLVSAVDPGPYGYAEYEEVWRRVLTGAVYHSSLAEKTGPNAALNAATATRTDLHVPIMVDGRFWGVLNFDDCTTERAWADGEIEVLRAAAEAVAAAVRRGELEVEAREVVVRERAQAAVERIGALADANAALANRLRLVEAAVQTADVLLASAEVGTAMPDVLARLGPALGADRAMLGRFDPPDVASRQGWLEVTHEWVVPGLARQMEDPALARLNIDQYGDVYARLQAGRIVQVRTRDLPDTARAEQAATGAVSQIVITVLVRAQLWGFLGFDDCRTDRVWDEAEVGLLQIVASSIGGALEREALVSARQSAERAQAAAVAAELATANDILRGTVGTLAGGGGIDSFVVSVIREAARVVDAATSVVFLYDPAEHAFHLSAGCTDGAAFVPDCTAAGTGRQTPTPADVTPVWRLLLAAQSPLLIHPTSDARYTWPDSVPTHRARGHRTVGYLRLQIGERPLGFLGLAWRADDPALAPDRVAVLIALGQQLALALELDRLGQSARGDAAQTAVLEERTRLAREMHDTIAQGLAGVVMQLDRVRAKLGAAAAPAAAELAVIDRLARDSLAEARRSLAMLRPAALEADGLAPALAAAVAGACPPGDADDRPATIATLDVRGRPQRLPPDVEMELLRIAQAALANACQHAAATTVAVELAFEPGGAVRVAVVDDGRGFDPAARPAGRFGLTGMSERAARIGATLAIVTAPGEGAEIVARWVPR